MKSKGKVKIGAREEEKVRASRLMAVSMIALGIVLFGFIIFAQRYPYVLFPPSLYILIFAVIFNLSNPLRQRILPATVNNATSIIVNFGAATWLIYLTGGLTSDLYIIYFLIPALGALYFGRNGAVACFILILVSYSLFLASNTTNLNLAVFVDFLLRLALLALVSLPFALFIEYERASIQELRKSYKELKQAHKKLKETQAQMIQAAKMSTLGQMATSIVHEVGQPLGSLNVYTKLALTKASRNRALKEDLSTIKEQLEKMNIIIGNIRGFSQKAETKMVSLDINECVEKTLRLVSKQFESGQIRVIRSLGTGFPKILGDSNQIEQVVLNILTNAKDGLEGVTDRPRKLSVETKLSADSTFVEMYISDNGCGIPKDCQKKIFEPFFTTKTATDGLGLGLPICKQIIENHQGTIDVTSTGGRGTTVKIGLPARGRLKTEELVVEILRFAQNDKGCVRLE